MELKTYERVHKLQVGKYWFFEGRHQIIRKILAYYSSSERGERVLDVGCSEGAAIEVLNQEKFKVVGIDIEDQALEFCKKRGLQNQILKAHIDNLPFLSESFDIVTAFDVMEHLDDDLKALCELKRVCKSKGIILLTVPAHQWLWSNNDVAYHHKRRYSLKGLKTLIKQAKLEMEKTSYFNTFLFPVFVVVTLMAKYSNNLASITLRPLPPIS